MATARLTWTGMINGNDEMHGRPHDRPSDSGMHEVDGDLYDTIVANIAPKAKLNNTN